MNCRRIRKSMPLYVGGEISDGRARQSERHLEACSDCREMAREFQSALAGLRSAARLDERDWPEAEWKTLMARIVKQPPPRRIIHLGMIPKTVWAYGAAALLILGLSAIIVRNRLFTAAPVVQTETIASTEIQPGLSLEFADDQFSRLRQDIPFRIRAEKLRDLESETVIAGPAGGRGLQDMVSMTLVSRETGLKVHWTFNRNFEWKEEEKR